MKYILAIAFTSLLLISCGNENKPKVIYQDTAKNTKLKKDSSAIKLANIPIHIDSTEYLLHPIGEYKIQDASKISYASSGSYSSSNFSISHYNNYSLTGNLSNLKFQKINSDKLQVLTSKDIKIKSVSFLQDIFINTQKQILVYLIIDKDTNQDGILNNDDIESLYSSNIDGSNFTKLTEDLQELIDWKVISANNRLYFRSLEDTDKNGKFNEEDKIYYQYVDFNAEKLEVTKYQPL